MTPLQTRLPHVRLYAVFDAQGPPRIAELVAAYRSAEPGRVRDHLVASARRLGSFDFARDRSAFDVVALPSLRCRFSGPAERPLRGREGQLPGRLVIPFKLETATAFPEFTAFLSRFLDGANPRVGVDLPVQPADHWCPGDAWSPIFGTRSEAGRLLGFDVLRAQAAFGQGVNVVVVDRGMNAALIPEDRFGGGWACSGGPETAAPPDPPPGTTAGGHGVMVVRNVRHAAPQATLYDCPILPPRVEKPGPFLSHVQAAYEQMRTDVAAWAEMGQTSDRWVFVNAWGLFDGRLDAAPPLDYGNGPDHPFNRLMAEMSGERAGGSRKYDVVFAAGNCGQFCPDWRCGPDNRGPGQGILGANSHGDVLTVGAVRTDALWLGYSSQGPGQPKLAHDKPDLCAASQFREDLDAHTTNTGTSAACGMAAGVVAALRGLWDPKSVPPAALRRHLRETARRPPGAGWSPRTGCGVLDCVIGDHVIESAGDRDASPRVTIPASHDAP